MKQMKGKKVIVLTKFEYFAGM
ncbi:hypothetical protein LCGC14_2733880, partial [marine sediment metagenome]